LGPLPALDDSAVDGPAVIERTVPAESVVAAVNEVATQWLKDGLAIPAEILVISAAERWHTLLGTRLADCDLVPVEERSKNRISHVAAGGCKGLESRAVIVAGFYPREQIPEGFRHSLFLAASRARVLLAIISVAPAERPRANPPAPTPDVPPAH